MQNSNQNDEQNGQKIIKQINVKQLAVEKCLKTEQQDRMTCSIPSNGWEINRTQSPSYICQEKGCKDSQEHNAQMKSTLNGKKIIELMKIPANTMTSS